MRNRRRFIKALCISFAVAIPSHGGEPRDIVIPQGWQPTLNQTDRSLENDLKDARAQMGINMISREIADIKDAELFVIYVQLFETLSPKERTTLCQQQGKWLKAREKHAKAAIESAGGSLAPYEANTAETDFTEKRIQQLTQRLRATDPKSR
jgi:uncharacterized protein YecT (DUF1311 family)